MRRNTLAPLAALILFTPLLCLALAGCGSSSASAPSDEPVSPLVEESMKIASRFELTLLRSMRQHFDEGGIMEAVGACRDEAPSLERFHAQQEPGVKEIRRISLRPRNAESHTPTQAEAKWLEQAESRYTSGQAISAGLVEAPEGCQTVLMPIVIEDQACLSCHGGERTLDPAITDYLQEHYENDQATGYAMGDLRGALAITWNAEPGERTE